MLAHVLLLSSAAGLVPAAPPALNRAEAAASVLSFLTGTSVDALAGSLRGYLVKTLPPTLYEASPGWGHQKEVVRGLKWKGQGIHVHPEAQKSLKNDGVWRKVRVTAVNLPDTLVCDLRNVRQPEPGRLTFDVFLSFDARIDYEQQNWNAGTRLYAGGTRARLRLKLPLRCEATARLDQTGQLLPDLVVRLRVVHADLHYDNFVVEHLGGVGGEAAKVLGDALKGGLARWHPELERDLLAQADAALVKAGDTKEVRVTLGNLLGKKGK